MFMDRALSFENHVIHLKKKAFKTLRNIVKIRFLLTKEQTKTIVNSMVVSCLDYCNGLFYGISCKLIHQLQLIQNAAAKAVTRKYKHDHLENDLKDLHWLHIKKRIIFKIALIAFKAVIGQAPVYIQEMFLYSHHGHTVKLIIPAFATKYGRRSFNYIGPRTLNNLPSSITSCSTVTQFKKDLKTHLFNMNSFQLDKFWNLCVF